MKYEYEEKEERRIVAHVHVTKCIPFVRDEAKKNIPMNASFICFDNASLVLFSACYYYSHHNIHVVPKKSYFIIIMNLYAHIILSVILITYIKFAILLASVGITTK